MSAPDLEKAHWGEAAFLFSLDLSAPLVARVFGALARPEEMAEIVLAVFKPSPANLPPDDRNYLMHLIAGTEASPLAKVRNIRQLVGS